ncbi:MAG: acyltransferase [Bacteroidales bacterium]|nr:acyltransferase [Bacteroidales bacterium]
MIRNYGVIEIGDKLNLNSGKKYNPIGGDTLTRLIVEKNGMLKIGNNVGVSNSTIYCVNSITIEDNVLIGGSCKLWDSDFHSLNPTIRGTNKDIPISKPIVIKKNAFIGSNSIILKGVYIGENSIIGAGSVITKNVPSNEIWAGNPAKYIRDIV